MERCCRPLPLRELSKDEEQRIDRLRKHIDTLVKGEPTELHRWGLVSLREDNCGFFYYYCICPVFAPSIAIRLLDDGRCTISYNHNSSVTVSEEECFNLLSKRNWKRYLNHFKNFYKREGQEKRRHRRKQEQLEQQLSQSLNKMFGGDDE